MKLFDVYSLFDLEPVRAKGSIVVDAKGREYLDFYGGHAVISIGHSHPHYIARITEQLNRLGFYSNSVLNPLQEALADKLGEVAELEGYELFLCNSGAEANENALKMASFARPGTNCVIAIAGAFHGRTSAAVNVTDNPRIQADINRGIDVLRFAPDDGAGMSERLAKGDVTAVLIEAVQGVGGLTRCPPPVLQQLETACRETGTPLILDEVQSGYGRTGKFFAYQHAGIRPDLISIAKGMGNGFPIGGVLIRGARFAAQKGMLGTTFGGNHLACAAGLAVLEVLEEEQLIKKVEGKAERLEHILTKLPGLRRVKGLGLMLGAEFDFAVGPLRKQLLHEQGLMTGSSSNPNILRILPPLTVSDGEIDAFSDKIHQGLTQHLATSVQL